MAARCQLEIRGKLSSRRSTPLHAAAPGPCIFGGPFPALAVCRSFASIAANIAVGR